MKEYPDSVTNPLGSLHMPLTERDVNRAPHADRPHLLSIVALAAVVLGTACSSSSPTASSDAGGDSREVQRPREVVDHRGPVDLMDFRGEAPRWDTGSGPGVCTTSNAGSGCPCADNQDCASGLCFFHLGEMVCSDFCETECQAGWACKQKSGVDPVFVCLSLYPSLCLQCAQVARSVTCWAAASV